MTSSIALKKNNLNNSTIYLESHISKDRKSSDGQQLRISAALKSKEISSFDPLKSEMSFANDHSFGAKKAGAKTGASKVKG